MLSTHPKRRRSMPDEKIAQRIPGLVGFRAASFAYRYAAVRDAAKLDQTQPIPAVIATIVCFYILFVIGVASDKLPSSIQWAKHLSFSIAITSPRAAVE